MAEQRKVIVPPKIPPPPPPRSRTPKKNAAASLLESTSSPSNPGATTNKASPASPPERQQKIRRPAPTPPDLSEAAKLLSSTSPPASKPPKQRPLVQPFGPRHPPVNMNPAGRDSPTPKSPSSAADLTAKKGFFQNVYSRTKDIFSRKKTTTYEPLPKQSASVASPPTSPQKRGFFKSLFDTKSTTTTTPIRLDDSSSDTESSPDRYSGDKDYSKVDDLNQSASYEVQRSADSDLSGTGSPLQFADTSSEISASDLEEAEALRPVNNCQIMDYREEQLLTIQVNTAADIRVATTVSGKVTTCVRTATGCKGKGRK